MVGSYVSDLSGSSSRIHYLETVVEQNGLEISTSSSRIEYLESVLEHNGLEISNLRAELEASKIETSTIVNARENRIHKYVASALAIAASELTKVKILDYEPTNSYLGEIFDLYGSDKNSRHSYAQVYENLLAGTETPRILEIGLGSLNDFPYAGLKPGCSLNAWRKRYPESFIVGADIDPESVQAVSEIAFLVDQTDPFSLDMLSKNLKEYGFFDLIVDDGFHDPHANVQTLIKLLPHLADDGAYIIEDVHSSLIDFWHLVIAALSLNGEVLDMSSLRPLVEDNVLVVIKGKLFSPS